MSHPTPTPHAHDLDWAAMVKFAELEAEALDTFLSEATTQLADLCDREALVVRRVLDVGSGPGVGTCALAERFPEATVVAVDGSSEMLANVTGRAERLGLAERVETRLVELPDGLGHLGPADMVWASMVLHHVGDETVVLQGLRRRLGPGGLLGLMEFADPTRFLPEGVDVGRPGLWERLDHAGSTWLTDMRAGLPGAVPSDEYPTMLAAAGFEVLVDRVVTATLEPPLDDRAREVVAGHLKLMRGHAEPYAEAADIQVLDALLDEDDPAGILRRPDALLHTSRRLIVARAV